jgi:hypothetical protein
MPRSPAGFLVAGLLLGAALGGLVVWLSLSTGSGGGHDLDVPRARSAPEPTPAPALRLEAPPPVERPTEEPRASASGGPEGADALRRGLALRVGDAVDLETWRVVERTDPSADLECLDLHSDLIVLGARHGGQLVVWTEGEQLFSELERDRARDLVRDAPSRLEPQDLVLTVSPTFTRQRPSLAHAAAGDGSAFLLWGEAVDFARSTLDRRAFLLGERVERRDGGGMLTTGGGQRAGEGPGAAEAERLKVLAAALPGFNASTARNFAGEWVRIERPFGQGTVAGFHKRFELSEPWARSLATGPWLSLHLAQGTTDSAQVILDHHSTVLHAGDQRGEALVRDHASLIIEGDLLGRVTVEVHGILVVRGRVLGTLKVGSWARVVLQRGPGGTLDLSSSFHAHLLLGGHVRRDDIPALGAPGIGSVLHLDRSDLASGTHEKLHGWQQVIVGDERWVQLGR